MQSTVTTLKRAAHSGTYASIASTLLLLACGVRDCRSAFAPVNAVSHWIWKDKAIHQQDATLRYSLLGYAIHHAASIFWALFYERWAETAKQPESARKTMARAAVMASVACAVDMRCTPERLTPGFERRLSRKSLLLVYGAFGLGLALHTLIDGRRR